MDTLIHTRKNLFTTTRIPNIWFSDLTRYDYSSDFFSSSILQLDMLIANTLLLLVDLNFNILVNRLHVYLWTFCIWIKAMHMREIPHCTMEGGGSCFRWRRYFDTYFLFIVVFYTQLVLYTFAFFWQYLWAHCSVWVECVSHVVSSPTLNRLLIYGGLDLSASPPRSSQVLGKWKESIAVIDHLQVTFV